MKSIWSILFLVMTIVQAAIATTTINHDDDGDLNSDDTKNQIRDRRHYWRRPYHWHGHHHRRPFYRPWHHRHRHHHYF
jgi:hypothetical protein